MPVNRAKWREEYLTTDFASWPCLLCGGKVRLRPETVVKEELAESKEAHESDAWDPDWIRGRFTAWMACNDCGDPCACAGRYEVVEFSFDEENGTTYVHQFRPDWFTDPPGLINIPDRIPDPVATELAKAFHVFWCDNEACANHIRSSVERLLDALRVRRFTLRKRKRVRIQLHHRIDEYKKQNAHLGAALEAVKWIGNAGTHSATLDRADLFDGFDLIEHVLEELYAGKRSKIAALSKAINHRKRPRSS
jgi:hypothetical protein